MTFHPANDARGVLYRGGSIITVDPHRPTAEAVATRDGRIVAVGAESDCRRALGLAELDHRPTAGGEPGHDPGGDGPAVVDLGGGALLPGFVDAHLHPMAMCFFASNLDLGSARTVADVLDGLSDRARVTAPGEWVVGLLVSADHLAERRLPSMAELDAVGAGRAVVLLGRDGHSSMGNTVALAAAGIRGGRVDPPGGAFERDAHGRLTGVCRETATQVLLGPVPEPGLDEMKASIQQVFSVLVGHGITSIGSILQTDAEGLGGSPAALESVGMMIFAEDLALGNHAVLCGDPARAIDARTSSSLHVPDHNRVVGGVKLSLDGTLGGRSACLHAPYTDAPHEQGWLTLDPAVAAARMEAIHLAGLQVCLHAIGDAANSVALDLFADLLARHPVASGPGPRHRIEHASVLDESSADRFAELGLVAVVQPPYLTSEGGWLPDRLGPERTGRVYAFRTLLDAGVVLAGSSDAPLESPDVLAGIAAAVTRHGFEPAQAVTAAEAVTMYTRGGAIAQRRDDVTGSLAEGLRADLVVLSDDPTAVAPEAIAGIDVRLTVVGGGVVHQGTTP